MSAHSTSGGPTDGASLLDLHLLVVNIVTVVVLPILAVFALFLRHPRRGRSAGAGCAREAPRQSDVPEQAGRSRSRVARHKELEHLIRSGSSRGHLERDIPPMAYDSRANLDQLLAQAGQRPRLRRPRLDGAEREVLDSPC